MRRAYSPSASSERRIRLRKRVLVVDPDVVARIELRLLLELQGYEVDEVVDGMEAIHCLVTDGSKIDLVILDYDMPMLNGIETLYSMREMRPGLKAILRSTDYERVCLYGKYLEGVAFLRKPCTLQDVSEALGVSGAPIPPGGRLKPSIPQRKNGPDLLSHFPPR